MFTYAMLALVPLIFCGAGLGMMIGITYDLREDYARKGYDEEQTAEFDGIETIAAIEQALSSLGHATERIGSAQRSRPPLGPAASVGTWSSISPKACMVLAGRRLVPALLDAYEIPYTFSDPLTLAVTLHKGMAKHIIRDQGIPTADFVVISAPLRISKK